MHESRQLLHCGTIRRQLDNLQKQFLMQHRHPGLGMFKQQLDRLSILDHRISDIAFLFIELSVELKDRDRYEVRPLKNQ